MRVPGIHFRLLVTAFLVISLTAFTLGTIGVKMFYDFEQNRFAERFEALARYLALNAELGILIDQRAMLHELAANLLSEADVAKVLIFNSANEMLAEASKSVPGPYEMVETLVRVKSLSDESQAFSFMFSSSITETPPEVIGKVQIIYSYSQINRLLKNIAVRYLWLTVGLAVLCIMIFFFISRSLVLPLTRLAQTARKVGEGELHRRMHPGNIPETREVSLAFNAMLDSLESGRKAVEKANQEMARRNLLAEMGKFSMMIAHEIKNPLSIIKSAFDILKKDPADPANTVLIGYIEEEIQRINVLIMDFLSFAKPAKPAFRMVDANAMLKECIERFGRLDTVREIEFKADIPETSCLSYIDPDLLRRAIDNILKNAVEACNGHGKIRVEGICGEDFWQMEISDSGCGIPEDLLDKIFDPFITTRAKGTGLGLAYTLQVVTAHHGTLTVSNRQPNGALFKIEVPREPKTVDFFQADEVKE